MLRDMLKVGKDKEEMKGGECERKGCSALSRAVGM